MADDAASPEGTSDPSTSANETADVNDKPKGGSTAVNLEKTPVEPESTAVELEASGVEVGTVEDGVDEADGPEPAETAKPAENAEPSKSQMSHIRLAAIAGLVLVLALGGLAGWMGYRGYNAYNADAERKLFLQVGRQGALNLTTIDWQHAEADVQRVLDSSTGTFYDDFQSRAEPFIQVVKQAQSKSVGAIAEAGLESASENEAQVLVAVNVNTTNAGAPEEQPRSWRMRISVQKVGDDAKVSNVEFVP